MTETLSARNHISTMKTYLIITRDKLGHHMQNTVTRELSWARQFLKFTVQLLLPLFVTLLPLPLHFVPNWPWDSPMMGWYVSVVAFLLIHFPMFSSVLSTRGITSFEEGDLLPSRPGQVIIRSVFVSIFIGIRDGDAYLHTLHHRPTSVSYLSSFFLNFTVTRAEKSSKISFVESPLT
jgi:hypothetical protein